MIKVFPILHSENITPGKRNRNLFPTLELVPRNFPKYCSISKRRRDTPETKGERWLKLYADKRRGGGAEGDTGR